MKRFKNILFVADRPGIASPGFSRALELARVNAAALTVMDVVEPTGWNAANHERFGVDLNEILCEHRLRELKELTNVQAGTDQLIRVQVATGTLFLEVIRATLRNGYDLVIKSAEDSEGLLQRGLGPNDQHLIRKCPCPVWIDRAERPRPYRTVLAAVDPFEDADIELDRLIMDLATSFQRLEDSEVHVVHAWRFAGESTLHGGRVRFPEEEIDAILDEKKAMHTSALTELLSRYDMDLDSPRVHFDKGLPAPVITEVAEDIGADLIVTGTVGRTGIPGFFIGNTAEAVIQATVLPVLAVKPPGFESPVSV